MKHKHTPRSIKWNILICFALFAVVTLAALWLCTTVFLDDIYHAIKTKDMDRAADAVVRLIGTNDMETEVATVAANYDMSIVVYRMNGDTDGMELVRADRLFGCLIDRIGRTGRLSLYRDTRTAGGSLVGLYRTVSPNTDSAFSQGEDASMPQNLIGGRIAEIDGETYFILLNSYITPVAATVSTMRILLAVLSVLVLVASAVLALILSRRIARPIVRIRDAAGELAQRRYDWKLNETAYREVAQLSNSLRYASAELSKVDDLYRELISNISHDLRTPLTMITGYAEIMRDIPGENKPENVQVIIDEANRLTSLVNDILDLSKFSSGAQTIRPEPFNLTESVKNTLLRYGKLASSRGYQIDFHYTSDVYVTSDEGRFHQALYNLVNNALTYTDESRRVLVEQTVHDGRVRISVTDYGEGIPKDQLPLLFERYYRAASSHRRPAAGNGLGLAIVRAVMESLGGSYGVTSTLGVGSTFWLELNCNVQ